MTSSQSLVLFSFFTSAIVLLKYIKRAKADSMPSLDAQYMSTIGKLFKFTFKLPSRHSVSPQMSSVELFQLRKTYFLANCFDSEILRNAKVIHIAGTKGKGSTVEYISAGLRHTKGKRVGVFTSPHLHTARERIKIGTNLISKEDIIRLGEESLEKMGNVRWAVFFDILLSLAMKYFSEQKVDYIVMEAGIGGRFDSTNFIDRSEVSVITSISLDHQALLGETVEEIAWQKAGIIKRNGNVFTSEFQDAAVLNVIKKQCAEMNATLHIVPVCRYY
jgi:folylpolyglutamate synthase/dihydrofolate synthase